MTRRSRGRAYGEFEELYHSYSRPVLAYIVRRVPREDADDALVETFAVAWRRRDRIPAGKELYWLYGVAYRVVANLLRGEKRRGQLIARLLDAEKVGRQRAWSPVDDERLEAAMATLKPEYREILRLAAWEQLGASEIAAVLGITANAASVRLSRARTALRDAYERGPGGES